MGPINYNQEVANPFAAYAGGFKAGDEIKTVELKQQQLQLQQQQAQQVQMDLAEVYKNPTTEGVVKLSLKYPQLSEHLKKSYDMLEPVEQASQLKAALPVYAAVKNNRLDIAKQLLTEQAAAYENSGNTKEAEKIKADLKSIEADPTAAKAIMGLSLAAAMGTKNFAENFGKLGAEDRAATDAPAVSKKLKADAELAEVKAKYGEKNEVATLAEKGWRIKEIEAEIGHKKDMSRIAAMQAAAAKQTVGLKAQELQLQINKAQTEAGDKVRAKVAEVTNARTSADNLLSTIDNILLNPSLNDVLGSIEGSLPAVLSDEAADAIANIETLGSQVFVNQAPLLKGTGNLSEKEGDKLQASLQNMSRRQSEKQFVENLKEVQRLTLKARANMVTKYGVPDTVPDTPNAAKGKDIEALIKKHTSPVSK